MSTENQERNNAGLKVLLSYGNFPLIVVEPKCKYSIIFILCFYYRWQKNTLFFTIFFYFDTYRNPLLLFIFEI